MFLLVDLTFLTTGYDFDRQDMPQCLTWSFIRYWKWTCRQHHLFSNFIIGILGWESQVGNLSVNNVRYWPLERHIQMVCPALTALTEPHCQALIVSLGPCYLPLCPHYGKVKVRQRKSTTLLFGHVGVNDGFCNFIISADPPYHLQCHLRIPFISIILQELSCDDVVVVW